MRLVASLLLCIAALAAQAAEIWRFRDANGVVRYTDFPVPGAERISVIDPTSAPATPPPPAAPPIILPNVISPPRPVNYTSCNVLAPRNDETFHGVQAVPIQLAVTPALVTGHRIQVMVNGSQRGDWPGTATSYTLPEVFRGSHTVSARVVDATGRVLCTGSPITFHLRQTSVLSPLNPFNPNNPNNPGRPRPPSQPPPTP